MRVEYDRDGLSIDGKRKLIRSASFDYFRLPSQSEWRDRIEKIAAAGFNCVAISYPWNFHADEPGSFDFDGIRDVSVLQRMVEDLGLYLIARTGPYVGGDLDAGGIPAWLLADPKVLVRCRASNGLFCFSPEFMLHVERWFDQLAPRLLECSNLILIEVEHQYAAPTPLAWLRSDLGSLIGRWIGVPRALRLGARLAGHVFVQPPRSPDEIGSPPMLHRTRGPALRNRYLYELVRLLRERGLSVPTTHSYLAPGMPRGDVDLPAVARRRLFGAATERVAFESELSGFRADAHQEETRIYLDLDAGVNDGWGGPGYAALAPERCPIEGIVLAALGAGARVFNVARFCGGTNWGYLGTPAVYSSYDSGAPIAEDGSRTPAYWALSRLNAWIACFEPDLCAAELVETRREGQVFMWSRRSRDHLFRFVQSASPGSESLAYSAEPCTRLTSFETQLRVYAAGGRFEAMHDPLRGVQYSERESGELDVELPELNVWKFSVCSGQTDATYDDDDWEEIAQERVSRDRIDLDSLGVHHGFIWYRGTFLGALDRLIIELRHSYAIWLNGRLIAQGEPHSGLHSLGFEPPERAQIQIPAGSCSDGRNALVILVESLGHPDDLAGGSRQRSGLIHLDTGSTRLRWRYRGGLVRGEGGLAPVVAFEAVDRASSREVSLPHAWEDAGVGVGLYEASFRLEGIDLEKCPLALRLDPSCGRANLYLNGILIGRYWPERGPQREFFLPRGVLREAPQENHIGIAVWKRWPGAALGNVRFVPVGT